MIDSYRFIKIIFEQINLFTYVFKKACKYNSFTLKMNHLLQNQCRR